MKRLFTISLVLLMLLGLLVGILPVHASAKSSKEIKEEIKALKGDQSAIWAQLDELKGEQDANWESIEEMVEHKNNIDQQIGLLYTEIENINTQIRSYSELIAANQEDLDAAEIKLAELNEKNKERIQAMEEEGEISYWSVIFKAKSFTDGDITLHFIIFDILHEPSVKCTLSEIMQQIDEKYLSGFENPMMFDESTVRKKLKEYTEAGIIVTEKVGRKVSYSRSEDTDVKDLNEVLHYYSEVAPCGVIGSFILDKEELDTEAFAFKHHYITGAPDSGVLAVLFTAMRQKRVVTLSNHSSRADEPRGKIRQDLSRILLLPRIPFHSRSRWCFHNQRNRRWRCYD